MDLIYDTVSDNKKEAAVKFEMVKYPQDSLMGVFEELIELHVPQKNSHAINDIVDRLESARNSVT